MMPLVASRRWRLGGTAAAPRRPASTWTVFSRKVEPQQKQQKQQQPSVQKQQQQQQEQQSPKWMNSLPPDVVAELKRENFAEGHFDYTPDSVEVNFA